MLKNPSNKNTEIFLNPNPEAEDLQPIFESYKQRDFERVFTNVNLKLKYFPRSDLLYSIKGDANLAQKKFVVAIEDYKVALTLNPDSPEIYYNQGLAFQYLGKLSEARKCYEAAIKSKPDYSKAFNNMGMIYQTEKNFKKALYCYKNAIEFNPNDATTYYNLAITLEANGDLEDAIIGYQQAIKRNPNNYEAFCNLGTLFQEKGDLKSAIENYQESINIKPHNPKAYNSMGNAFQDKGDLEEAIQCYKQAIKIQPKYFEALWNMHGTAKDITDAQFWITECLRVNKFNLEALMMDAILKFYDGNKSSLQNLIKSQYANHPIMRSFQWVIRLPHLPKLYFSSWNFFDAVIEKTFRNRPFYEFGVWHGNAFNYIIKKIKTGYGFDTFTGLPENWHNVNAGSYSSGGVIPKIKGGHFIPGKFEDTLPKFFSQERPVASLINFDADLYTSTSCALNWSKPIIDKFTILIFDEFIMNENWEEDEYKALNEFCTLNHLEYEVIAISFFTKQVAIRLVGI